MDKTNLMFFFLCVRASGRVCVVVCRVAPAVAVVGCRCVGGGAGASAVLDGEK